ncbi:MAG: sugar phosphate isomerase/epimerase [Spirochaetales bacterium]|nr:MAG: sugar phosphate isomerase/epimerase [Spirochaetales bacterium]
MKIGIFTGLFGDWPLEKVAKYVSGLGYEAVELPIWAGNSHLDLEDVLAGKGKQVKRMLEDHGLVISAINHSIAGQLSMGPHDVSTDAWAPGMTPEQKVAFAIEQCKKSARAAAELGVPVVNGLIGSHVWDKWYIFPPANEKLYEEGMALFAERWNIILDEFKKCGVKWGLEVHPTGIAYNIETAEQALAALDNRPEFGFNFDPSHLVWQLIDPVIFIKTFADRIFHCHAKDGELQEDEVRRSGVIPTGGWMRRDRGFRFRVPGWGQVDWRRIITALVSCGYDYVMSFEHEDPVMSPEDGAEKAIEYLRPLMIKKPLTNVWW